MGLIIMVFFSQQRELHCYITVLVFYKCRDIPALHTFSRLASWLRQALKNTLNARVKSRFAVAGVLPKDIETTLLCRYVGWKRNGKRRSFGVSQHEAWPSYFNASVKASRCDFGLTRSLYLDYLIKIVKWYHINLIFCDLHKVVKLFLCVQVLIKYFRVILYAYP